MLRGMVLLFSEIVSFLTAAIELAGTNRMVVWLPFLAIIPLLIAIPRTAHLLGVVSHMSREWLYQVEWRVLAIVVLNAPGSLWLHGAGIQYDRFLHFSVAFFAAQIVVLVLVAYFQGERKRLVLGVAAVLAFVSLFAWEAFQWGVDVAFGTTLFFDVAQHIDIDFWEDILYGFTGAFLSLVLIYLRYPIFVSRLEQVLK